MPQPPLLPEEVLSRVVRMAWRNGWSIVLVAGIAAVLQASIGQVLVAIAAVLAAGTGAMEVHGAGLLRHGDRRGIVWAIRGELLLLCVIWLYCALRLARPDLTEVRAAFHASLELPWMRSNWAELQRTGVTEEQYLQAVYQLTYIALALAALLYQGAMTIYYSRRRAAVEAALDSGVE